jgi:tetratricopeptide (TPR) repeat protein
VQLPKEARDFISNLEKKALANPKDVTVLNRLGDVSLRAAQFDPSYYGKAADAYGRVLKIDPDNLDALRGVGNIDFDQHKADQAIAAYEHYLGRKPDDPDVRTDLATMLLTSGAADQAVFQYKKVIEAHPTFFEANFNLGVAYGEMNDLTSARAQFDKALKLAPDSTARDRVNQMIASLNSETAPGVSSNLSPASAPQAVTNAASAAPATFHGAIETMLHDIPFAGPKVEAVQWSSQNKARVLMNNFPMDQMPEFAAAKFVSDLKQGIDQAKSAHNVSGQVELDICDASSGRVMKSITE